MVKHNFEIGEDKIITYLFNGSRDRVILFKNIILEKSKSNSYPYDTANKGLSIDLESKVNNVYFCKLAYYDVDGSEITYQVPFFLGVDIEKLATNENYYLFVYTHVSNYASTLGERLSNGYIPSSYIGDCIIIDEEKNLFDFGYDKEAQQVIESTDEYISAQNSLVLRAKQIYEIKSQALSKKVNSIQESIGDIESEIKLLEQLKTKLTRELYIAQSDRELLNQQYFPKYKAKVKKQQL